MLTYTTSAAPNGYYHVTYMTPGCDVPTVAAICTSQEQADKAVTALNKAQIDREKVLQADRMARGLGGVYHGLKTINK